MLRSDRLRADQCRVGTSVTADVGADLHAIVPIMSLGRDRLIVRAHDRIVAERRDDARAVSGGKPRQRRDIEMVVMRMRDQDDIDRRQSPQRRCRDR